MDHPETQLYICWTVDWQDNYLWSGARFVAVSRRLLDVAAQIVDGRLSWLAEVDDLTDVTQYAGVSAVARAILRSGGEIGIHVHHTSVAPDVRLAHYRRAAAAVRLLGAEPVAYAAGMGNYIDEDTRLLVSAGINVQRSYTGAYVNGALPPDDWLPPRWRGRVAALLPPATFNAIRDPRQNPAACDWRGAPDSAGYVDPADYRRRMPAGDLFAVPLGATHDNADGRHQLHVQPEIDLNRLSAVFASFAQRSEREPVFIACYFHPYDLLAGDELSDQLLDRWAKFAARQRQAGGRFVTLSEARAVYNHLHRV